jgi:hypothetical protein
VTQEARKTGRPLQPYTARMGVARGYARVRPGVTTEPTKPRLSIPVMRWRPHKTYRRGMNFLLTPGAPLYREQLRARAFDSWRNAAELELFHLDQAA